MVRSGCWKGAATTFPKAQLIVDGGSLLAAGCTGLPHWLLLQINPQIVARERPYKVYKIDVLVEFEPGHTPGLAFFGMEDELARILKKS